MDERFPFVTGTREARTPSIDGASRNEAFLERRGSMCRMGVGRLRVRTARHTSYVDASAASSLRIIQASPPEIGGNQ